VFGKKKVKNIVLWRKTSDRESLNDFFLLAFTAEKINKFIFYKLKLLYK